LYGKLQGGIIKMNMRSLIISALLIGLFMYAMISFGAQLAIDNEANQSILDHDSINDSFRGLDTQLGNAQDQAQSQRVGFEGENIEDERSDSLLFLSIVSAARVFTSMLINIYNLTFGLASETLGINPVIIGVFSAILLIVLLLMAWRLIKTGE